LRSLIEQAGFEPTFVDSSYDIDSVIARRPEADEAI